MLTTTTTRRWNWSRNRNANSATALPTWKRTRNVIGCCERRQARQGARPVCRVDLDAEGVASPGPLGDGARGGEQTLGRDPAGLDVHRAVRAADRGEMGDASRRQVGANPVPFGQF